MRRAARVEVMAGGDGTAWGLLLASAACAEHEWGVRGIDRALGIHPVGEGRVGVDARRMTRPPSPGCSVNLRDEVAPDDGRRPSRRRAAAPPVPCAVTSVRHLDPSPAWRVDARAAHDALCRESEGRAALDAWWDEDGFLVAGYGAPAVAAVGLVSDAVRDGDLAAWLNRPSRVSETCGLLLAAASAVPREVRGVVEAADLDALALAAAVAATGIVDRVRAAKGRAFGLAPRWRKDRPWAPTAPSAHEVAFWLSAADRGTCVEGWYTVEQLDEWIAGRGPAHVDGARPGPVAGLHAAIDALSRRP